MERRATSQEKILTNYLTHMSIKAPVAEKP